MPRRRSTPESIGPWIGAGLSLASAMVVVAIVTWGLQPAMRAMVAINTAIAPVLEDLTRGLPELGARGGIALAGIAVLALLAAKGMRQ